MFRKSFVGGVLILGLLLIGAFGATALAADNSDIGADKMKEAYQSFISKLAANLGVEESVLEAALETTQEEILAEQVESGVITQEQADKMSEMGFNFGCIGGHGGPPLGGHDGKGGPKGPGGPPPGDTSTSS